MLFSSIVLLHYRIHKNLCVQAEKKRALWWHNIKSSCMWLVLWSSSFLIRGMAYLFCPPQSLESDVTIPLKRKMFNHCCQEHFWQSTNTQCASASFHLHFIHSFDWSTVFLQATEIAVAADIFELVSRSDVGGDSNVWKTWQSISMRSNRLYGISLWGSSQFAAADSAVVKGIYSVLTWQHQVF